MNKIITLALTLLVLTGCAQNAQREAAAVPDLSGPWTFEVQTGQSVVRGAMTLTAKGQGYRGTLTTSVGDNVIPVRSLTLAGSNIDMLAESPQGNVTFKGVLSADGSSFDGTVTYHNGQTFPMSGTRGTR